VLLTVCLLVPKITIPGLVAADPTNHRQGEHEITAGATVIQAWRLVNLSAVMGVPTCGVPATDAASQNVHAMPSLRVVGVGCDEERQRSP
jgi:hypothetical protein